MDRMAASPPAGHRCSVRHILRPGTSGRVARTQLRMVSDPWLRQLPRGVGLALYSGHECFVAEGGSWKVRRMGRKTRIVRSTT